MYVPLHVRPSDLKTAIDGLRAINIQGFNVTIPHKESIINYLDHIDETASAIGAVNTVVNQDGRLIGYNTDGIGGVLISLVIPLPILLKPRVSVT